MPIKSRILDSCLFTIKIHEEDTTKKEMVKEDLQATDAPRQVSFMKITYRNSVK